MSGPGICNARKFGAKLQKQSDIAPLVCFPFFRKCLKSAMKHFTKPRFAQTGSPRAAVRGPPIQMSGPLIGMSGLLVWMSGLLIGMSGLLVWMSGLLVGVSGPHTNAPGLGTNPE
jgi:hypothetical protein